MFEYSLIHWTTFLTAAFVLNLAPGPDIAFSLSQSVRGGRKTGFAAMLGVWTGATGHVLLAALGLSAIVSSSATAFTIVKIVGVVYLVWLGIQSLRSKGGTLLADGADHHDHPLKIYRQGVLVNILNPKVAVFFLAFLPQFIVEGAGPIWAQLVLHGVLVIVVAAAIEPPLILIGDGLARKLRDDARIGLWLDRTLGVIFLGLAARLALQER